jgi:4-amino-4-deoxy-L-arabinose transferase-like glycosyltransferase
MVRPARASLAASVDQHRPMASRLSAEVPAAWVAITLLVWVLIWVVLPYWSELVPPSDNIEQLVWSQGLELGYHKHPPMPTWILIGAEQLFPATVLLTHVLSMLGMAVGGYFLWRLAADLLVDRSAAWAVVLATGCIAFYSYRAHIYNDNTVLVPFVYAAAWFFLRAVRTGRTLYWVLLGVASAGAMLTKYQFAIVLATFVLIAVSLRLYRQPQALRGAAIAAVTAAVLLSPHIGWLFTHDFLPLRYANAQMWTRLGPLQRLDISGGFFLQQLRDTLAPVVMLFLAIWFTRGSQIAAALAESDQGHTASPGSPASSDNPWSPDTMVWARLLGFAPLTLLVLLGFLGGARLENHWGTTAMQFVVLPLVAWLHKRRRIPAMSAALAAFIILQAIEVGYVITADMKERHASSDGGRMHAFDPALLSRAVITDWHKTTDAPLHYVVGPTIWGGFVSVYSTERPQVMIDADPSAAPWVSVDDLARCGGVYIEPIQPPAQASMSRRSQFVAVDYSNAHRGQPLIVTWAVVPPARDCREPIAKP